MSDHAAVHVHLPGRAIPATLTTDHPAARGGEPVLVQLGTAHRPAHMTRYGIAAGLLVDAAERRETAEEAPEGAGGLLDAWKAASARERSRHGDFPAWPWGTMAEMWLAAGGWRDGARWSWGGESLVHHLETAPLHREEVVHVTEDGDEAPALAWTFPDSSGVVDQGDTWDAFRPDGRTAAGRVERRRLPRSRYIGSGG